MPIRCFCPDKSDPSAGVWVPSDSALITNFPRLCHDLRNECTANDVFDLSTRPAQSMLKSAFEKKLLGKSGQKEGLGELR